ncbi:MAG: hypothetical protein AAF799_08300 [Myxococcota bacterium]
MIDLGRPALTALGVTLFPDHADPGLFHYLPDRPSLVWRDDEPELRLVKYRLDPELHQVLGGGLLSFMVDLRVDEEVLSSLRSRLLTRFDLDELPTLVPVAADQGQCRLVVMDRANDQEGESILTERILGAVAPSLYGHQTASFMAVLSPEGTSVAEAALQGGDVPVAVVYELRTQGIRPALRARVVARWRDVYEYYENRLHGGKLLLAVDIGAMLEDLIRSEQVQVEVDHLVPEDQHTAAYDAAVKQVLDHVLEEFFRPTLGQAPTGVDTEGNLDAISRAVGDVVGLFAVTYSLRSVDRNELKTLTWEMRAARAEHLTLAPQGILTGLWGEDRSVDLDDIVLEVEPGPNPEMEFDVGCAVDMAKEGIESVEVRMSYGEREERLLLTAAEPRAQVKFWFDAEQGPEVGVAYTAHLPASDDGPAAALEQAQWKTDDRVLRVDPRELFRRVDLRVVALGVPFEDYPTVIVDVAFDTAAGGSIVRTHELSATGREATMGIRVGAEEAVGVRARVRYVDESGDETARDWETVEPGTMVVGHPHPDVLDVQVLGSAMFGTEVARLIVELRLDSNEDEVQTLVLDRDKPFATWSVPLPEPEERGWSYRVTSHSMLNEVEEGEWLPSMGTRLVVGTGIAQLREVQLMILGATLASAGLLGIKVRFEYEDPDNDVQVEEERLIRSVAQPQKWRFPQRDPEVKQWSYQLTKIAMDGTSEELDPVTTTALIAVFPLT